MMEISGKTAVVTGAGSGIGRSIALALSEEGANVAVVDIDHGDAEAVAADIRKAGVRSSAHRADVAKLGDVSQLADEVYHEYGTVEILINNAGVNLRPQRASWDTSYEDFQWVMSVNFWGVLHGHHVFIPRMLRTEGRKHVVNTSSMASFLAIEGQAAYTCSKYAVDGLSKVARAELKTQDIGVSILHPGPIQSQVASGERRRPHDEQSAARKVKPWSDYVLQAEADNPYVKGRSERAHTPPTVNLPDIAATPFDYISSKLVGQQVIEGIRENKPHILTHPAPIDQLRSHLDAILTASPQPPRSSP